MIIRSAFNPAWWLKNPHAQTIYPTLMHHFEAPIDHIERIELTDGDFIDLSWATKGLDREAPLVILLHGLGGGVNSVYVAGLLSAFNRAGYRGVLMHFRGASHEPNRLPRAYHSGDTQDLKELLNCLKQREPHTKKAVVGVSLGGNVLLKWLGETGEQTLIDAAVAISVPFQLEVVTARVNQGFSRVYQSHLLKKLQRLFLNKLTDPALARELPFSKSDLLSIKTLREFDKQVTAPLHGFSSEMAYYQEASSKQYLRRIKTPTLIIHAEDDPFMLPNVIPTENELSNEVIFELSQCGGHVGFISGPMPGRAVPWLAMRVPTFLSDYL